ncbi:MAG: endospore germination permease [Bacilli bacterium]|nr:endospore germination permease [Bacilli bacterium]
MMNTKISNKGFASLLFFSSQSMFLGVGITQMLNSSEQSSPLSIILGFILGFIILYFFIKLFNYEKDLDLFKKIEKLFGKGIGNIINIILVLLFVLYFIYTLWSIQLYIQNKYLDKTPSIIILILFLIPVVYSVNSGIKTISKVSLIIFFISIIEILLSIFGLTSFIEIDNLKPFFNIPFITILKNSLYFISYFLTPTILMLTIPKNQIDNQDKINKRIIIFYIFGCINFLLLFIFIISIFGIELSKLFYYPEFTLIKKINYFDFIQHVENILSTQWLFSLFISAVMSLFFVKSYLNHKNIDRKKIYYPFIIISLILSTMLFKNTTIAYNVVKDYYIFVYTIPIFSLIIISIIIARFKKNKAT